MRKIIIRLFAIICLLFVAMSQTSCVHEFPEYPESRRVNLRITHQLPWSMFEHTTVSRSSRAMDDDEWMYVEYLFEVHPAGSTSGEPLKRFKEYVEYSDRLPMSTVLELPAGEYDVWIWSCFIDPTTGETPYFNTDTFSAIKLKGDYVGNTYQKDAHQGYLRVSIPESIESNVELSYEVELTRPLTAHAFIATDVDEFIEMETKRRSGDDDSQTAIDFSQYTAKITHTGYMVNEYSVFRNRPTDSALGITYSGPLEVTPDGDVLIAYDTFFISEDDSTLSLGIEIFDPEGKKVSTVGNITIPTQRNRATIVRGSFLTSKATGGIGIDNEFEGDFNIKI